MASISASAARARHPGGESLLETQARVVSALEAICARHAARELVACVFHSDPIKLAVAHFIGLPLDHFQRLGCDTASVDAACRRKNDGAFAVAQSQGTVRPGGAAPEAIAEGDCGPADGIVTMRIPSDRASREQTGPAAPIRSEERSETNGLSRARAVTAFAVHTRSQGGDCPAKCPPWREPSIGHRP